MNDIFVKFDAAEAQYFAAALCENIAALRVFELPAPTGFSLTTFVAKVKRNPQLCLDLLEEALCVDVRPGNLYGVVNTDVASLVWAKTVVLDWTTTQQFLVDAYHCLNIQRYRYFCTHAAHSNERESYSRLIYYYLNFSEHLSVEMLDAITHGQYSSWFGHITDKFGPQFAWVWDGAELDMHSEMCPPPECMDIANTMLAESVYPVAHASPAFDSSMIDTPLGGQFVVEVDEVIMMPLHAALSTVHSLYVLAAGQGPSHDMHVHMLIVAVTDYLVLLSCELFACNMHSVSRLSERNALAASAFSPALHQFITVVVRAYYGHGTWSVVGALSDPLFCGAGVVPECVYGFSNKHAFCHRPLHKHDMNLKCRTVHAANILLSAASDVKISKHFVSTMGAQPVISVHRHTIEYVDTVVGNEKAVLVFGLDFDRGEAFEQTSVPLGSNADCALIMPCACTMSLYIGGAMLSLDQYGLFRTDTNAIRHMLNHDGDPWVVAIGNASFEPGYMTPRGKYSNGWCVRTPFMVGRQAVRTLSSAIKRLTRNVYSRKNSAWKEQVWSIDFVNEKRAHRFIDIAELVMEQLPEHYKTAAKRVSSHGLSPVHSALISFSYCYACLSPNHQQIVANLMMNDVPPDCPDLFPKAVPQLHSLEDRPKL